MATQKDIGEILKDIEEILTEAYNQGYNNAVYNILGDGIFSIIAADVIISSLLDMLLFFLISRFNPYENLTLWDRELTFIVTLIIVGFFLLEYYKNTLFEKHKTKIGIFNSDKENTIDILMKYVYKILTKETD
ncbi:hypothetical protein [Thermoanaerobacter mathranii]|uniref:hypothetical protein n=1 Tax=Thermoanaerobacter mathranii TaxID=583357 RepID=UPI0019D85C6E|nr:hypothetical protein [Caldanaerobacter subterraneus]